MGWDGCLGSLVGQVEDYMANLRPHLVNDTKGSIMWASQPNQTPLPFNGGGEACVAGATGTARRTRRP